MNSKPQMTVRLQASGVNADGLTIEARAEGPAADYEQLKAKVEGLIEREGLRQAGTSEKPEEEAQPTKAESERKSRYFS